MNDNQAKSFIEREAINNPNEMIVFNVSLQAGFLLRNIDREIKHLCNVHNIHYQYTKDLGNLFQLTYFTFKFSGKAKDVMVLYNQIDRFIKICE